MLYLFVDVFTAQLELSGERYKQSSLKQEVSCERIPKYV